MSTVQCKNCGAGFDAGLSKCPYCGTMNKGGAYAEFRRKISSMIDAMLCLKDNAQLSVSRMILSALLSSLLIIAVIVGLAFAFSRTAKINYRSDKEYDLQAYEEITWMDENLDRLNEAYENGDYKTVEKLYYEKSGAVQKWSRYPSYCLKYAFEKIETYERFDSYQFQRMLHFIYCPKYFAGYNGMNRVDAEEYGAMRDALLAELEAKGYSAAELETIYEKCSDSYGFVDSGLLKDYVKEGGNG